MAAISLIGISCASAGRGGGGGPSRPAVPLDPGAPAKQISRVELGGLPVSKWRLGNGLEVLLAPDPSATSVAFMTWYRVGSRHEDPARNETGLAHLFEHLMFTQTTSAKDPGEFDQRMESVGANVNAMTYYDFTAYVDSLPPDALPLAIELEADRMVNLALRDEQVETEREVVAEERLGSVEDSVDGILDEMVWGQSFKAHPYRLPVIGLMKDIKGVTPSMATGFYRRFYAPNNAVLVVAGRFDEQATIAAIETRFREIPPSPTLPVNEPAPERAPRALARATIERPVPADRFVMAWPGIALGATERATYEIIDELLTGGPSSRLYRTLVVTREIASSVDGGLSPTRDPGLYTLWVQMKKGHTAAEAEALIDEELTRLATQLVPEQELTKARNRLETDFWRQLSSSEGRAEQLGEFEIAGGGVQTLVDRAAAYARVRPEDVQRVAREYLTRETRTVVVARPKLGKNTTAAE